MFESDKSSISHVLKEDRAFPAEWSNPVTTRR